MKVLLLLTAAFVAFISTAVIAQTVKHSGKQPAQKRSLMLGTSMLNVGQGLGSEATGTNTRLKSGIGSKTRAGYFVHENLVLGLSLNTDFAGSSSLNIKQYGGGGFARYYFGKIAGNKGEQHRVHCFVEGGCDFNKGIVTDGNSNDGPQRGTFITNTAYIMPGVNFFLSKNVALEGGCFFRQNLGSQNAYSDNNAMGVSVGVQLFPGW